MPMPPLPLPLAAVNNMAKNPNDLEKLFVSRANARDVDGLVQLYEAEVIVETGDGILLVGPEVLKQFFESYVANGPRLSKSKQLSALTIGDLALTSSIHSNGDVSVEVARRRTDGTWRWVIDRFSIGKLERNLPRLPRWLP